MPSSPKVPLGCQEGDGWLIIAAGKGLPSKLCKGSGTISPDGDSTKRHKTEPAPSPARLPSSPLKILDPQNPLSQATAQNALQTTLIQSLQAGNPLKASVVRSEDSPATASIASPEPKVDQQHSPIRLSLAPGGVPHTRAPQEMFLRCLQALRGPRVPRGRSIWMRLVELWHVLGSRTNLWHVARPSIQSQIAGSLSRKCSSCMIWVHQAVLLWVVLSGIVSGR